MDNIEWITAVERKHSPLFISFLLSGQSRDKLFANTGLNIEFKNILKDGLRLAYDSEEIRHNRLYIKNKIKEKGENFFVGFHDACLESCYSFIEKTKKYFEFNSISALSDSRLLEVIEDYFLMATSHASFLQSMILVQFELEDYLSKLIKDNELSNEVIPVISISDKVTHEVENGLLLFEIGCKIQGNSTEDEIRELFSESPDKIVSAIPVKNSELWNYILNYKEAFSWSGRMYYDGDPLSEMDIIFRLQNILSFNCCEKKNQQKESRLKRQNDRDIFVNKKRMLPLKNISKIISDFLFLRSFRLDAFFISHEYMVPFFNEVSKRRGITYKNIINLSFQEIIKIIEDKTYVSEYVSLSTKRMKKYSVLKTDRDCTWFTYLLSESNKKNKKIEETNVAVKLKGVSASPGYVKGKVHVVLNEDDMYKMNQGDILVTTMTVPSLMLAVEKASAIVTNEGGMLCHAAIVSREFEIPCVIATNNATILLKSGDKVIVDANNSIVEKI